MVRSTYSALIGWIVSSNRILTTVGVDANALAEHATMINNKPTVILRGGALILRAGVEGSLG
jgi:hypothetical protein